MRFSARAAVSATTLACAVLMASPVRAAGDFPVEAPPARAGTATAPMDPALRSALTGIATLLLADFAGRMANGSTDGFDPGPALQGAMRKLLESDAAERLIDGALAQTPGSGGEGGTGLPPELRTLLAAAARAAVANARQEISREFASP